MSEREMLTAFNDELKEVYDRLIEIEVKYTPSISGDVLEGISNICRLLICIRSAAENKIIDTLNNKEL